MCKYVLDTPGWIEATTLLTRFTYSNIIYVFLWLFKILTSALLPIQIGVQLYFYVRNTIL